MSTSTHQDVRPFFEVFQSFDADAHTKNLLSNATIRRISTNRAHDTVRVYLNFPTLVPKRRIRRIEETLKDQYFKRAGCRVHVIETFSLSDAFSPEILFENYKDSILEELDAYSAILESVFRRADVEFEGENLHLTLEDTVISHQREEELTSILDKILCDRCGQTVRFTVDYKKPIQSRYFADSDRRIENRIADIVRAANAGEEETAETEDLMMPAPGQEDSAGQGEKQKEKAPGPKDHQQKSAPKKEKGGFQRKQDAPKKTYSRRRSNNPNVIYGREFDEDPTSIAEIIDEMGEVVIGGEILEVETRELRTGKLLLKLTVTDDTDTITAKIFLNPEAAEPIDALKAGSFIRLKGVAQLDPFDHDIGISGIRGIMKSSSFRSKRTDPAPVKRVELACHTKMSDMDGVSDVKDLIGRAIEWGHTALAVTDNGVASAFPDAAHALPKGSDFKVIYGAQCYLVDDEKRIAANTKNQSLTEDSFVVFDLETTGLNAKKAKIIEIGAVKFEHGEITDRFSEFCNPEMPIPYRITELTTITDQMVENAETIDTLLPKFKEFCGDAVLVAHNADFDTGCIRAQSDLLGIEWEFTYVDTIPMAKFLLKQLTLFGLEKVAKALSVPLLTHHRAVDDAECTALIFDKLAAMLTERGIHTLDEMNEAAVFTEADIRRERARHMTILAKNDLGRVHLYRLISESHLNYFGRRKPQQPKLPKSLVEEWREGLLIGSGDSEGELYQAILQGKADSEVARIVEFYDYLEVQPAEQNARYLTDDKYGTENIEDLRAINERIIEWGRLFNKPVVATGDVHFLDPKDEVYRRILRSEEKDRYADPQPPLYLHSTEEMLSAFEWLGEEKAYEIVVENTNKIADMCEFIEPTRPDKCPPVIADSDKMLREICYNKAHEVYGKDLPEVVTARLERELNSIISNGYAVMYIIAQKLVWKSNEDGYLVGSRGSVGSSFVATMAGITEVNPLSPHYICPECHYTDFDSDEVKEYAGRAGCDMPDAVCPNCGKPLVKEGFDIPFETFLGFKGNKEPDIDLNFSGDYQNKAHRYTEVIFGEGQTFRAGTIGTMADKTAYGYIRHYYESRGSHKRHCEINRLVKGCVGVRRTTGQHPGGIIVLPMGEDIYSFTPIQHPANKETDIITTHFDYHSIDSNLLKLDILGHDDPTMIRMLEDITGIDAQKIPLDDKTVMTLFMNTEPLGVTPDDLWNHCELGTLGIPEFGTDFAMGMLRDAGPTEFSDLVRISGLSHGTDVWLGNAKDLIAEGKATISTCICTRDDIMSYLINKGLESERSFKIMESVRKGIVAKGKCADWDEWKADMAAHDVPDWYIESCEKIKYMFPKAHAAAYVMMAWRIAWFKIFEPLAYYAAYFSIRTNFDYEKMCQGRDRLERELALIDQREAELKKENKKLTANDKSLYMDMRSVQEMYARGFEFLPMDLYESDARYFKVKDGKLIPPFCSIAGMGDVVAETLAAAAAESPFLSKDDIKERGKVSATLLDTMGRLGILKGLPESNQLSLFDRL